MGVRLPSAGLIAAAACLLAASPAHAAGEESAAFEALVASFVAEWPALGIRPLERSYAANFENIPSIDQIVRRTRFLEKTRARLRAIRAAALAQELRPPYETLAYQVDLHLER